MIWRLSTDVLVFKSQINFSSVKLSPRYKVPKFLLKYWWMQNELYRHNCYGFFQLEVNFPFSFLFCQLKASFTQKKDQKIANNIRWENKLLRGSRVWKKNETSERALHLPSKKLCSRFKFLFVSGSCIVINLALQQRHQLSIINPSICREENSLRLKFFEQRTFSFTRP